MNSALKVTLAVGVALAASAANAGIVTNTGGAANGSDLVLFVKDTTTTAFYVEDLGFQIQSLQNRSTVASDPIFGQDNTGIGPVQTGHLNDFTSLDHTSANAAAFFAAHSGDSFQWSILGVDVTGGTQAPGNERVVFTSNQDHLNGFYWGSADVDAAGGNMNSFFINDLNTSSFTNGASPSSGWGDAKNPGGQQAPSMWSSFPDGAAVGTSQQLWLAATYGNGNGANMYTDSVHTLKLTTDGHLSVVPLPAAVWLLGSGLLGLVGVGRRRVSVEPAAA